MRAIFSPSRLALSYIALGASVLALFAIPLWYAWQANIATFRDYVDGTDLQQMLDVFSADGARGLAAALDRRVADSAGRDEVIVLADAARQRIAGNLKAWPSAVPDAPGTYGLVIDGADAPMRVVATHIVLPGGYHLLIGRESARFQSLTEWYWYGIFGAAFVLVSVGAAVGWMSRRALLVDVQTISETASAIIAGDASQQLATKSVSSDLEALARTINGMLERLASKSKDDLQLVIDTIPGLVWSALPDGHTDFLNQRWRDYTGLTLEQASGWGWQVAIHPDDLPGLLEYWKSLLASPRPGEIEARLRRYDGVYRWFLFRGVPLYNEAGRLVKWYGTNTDLEDRKEAEALVAAEKRLLEEIAKGSPLTRILDTACRLVEELAPGLRCSVVLVERDGRLRHAAAPSLPGSYKAAVDACNIDAGLGPCALAVSSAASVAISDIRAEDRWPEYQRLAAAYEVRACTSVPIKASDGKVLGTLAALSFEPGNPPPHLHTMMEQFTRLLSIALERACSEEALRESEQRFMLAVEGANDGIWDWDVVTGEMFFSERTQRILGLPLGPSARPRSEWRAMTQMDPEDAERSARSIDEFLAGSSPTYDEEWRVRHARGTYRWIRVRGVCLRDAHGKAYRMAGSIEDITDRKAAEEELRRLERRLRQSQRLEAVGTLAGGIAHDFNNILGAILGYGEMAVRHAPKESRLRRDLESIVAAGERGRALVDRILAFSRSAVGDRVPVLVEEVVREALDLLSAKVAPGITIEARLDAGQAAILGDATQVHQVLMNLATNGIHAMTRGGVLRVSLTTARLDSTRPVVIGLVDPGEYVVLSVADTGSGIAPDVLERMFDPFFTTRDVGVGTGLGLSLVHGIVSQLGGAIDVSTALGSGSTFTIYLPRIRDVEDGTPDETPGVPHGGGERVLVVDDEESLVALAKRTLEELGYVAEGFVSPTAALEAFRAAPQRFDAVLTDERMPGMSGAALISAVRGVRRSIPILLVSGYVGGMVTNRAYNAGATEVLKKPLSRAELATSLARALHVDSV